MPTKRGQTFVLNRITGKPISNVVERQAPKSIIPDDVRSPTQPWSVDIPRLGFSDLTESKCGAYHQLIKCFVVLNIDRHIMLVNLRLLRLTSHGFNILDLMVVVIGAA